MGGEFAPTVILKVVFLGMEFSKLQKQNLQRRISVFNRLLMLYDLYQKYPFGTTCGYPFPEEQKKVFNERKCKCEIVNGIYLP
jgi:hypothetical protein